MNKNLIYLFAILLSLSSCSIIKQSDELITFSKCKFEYKNINNVKIGGIELANKTSIVDFSFSDLAKLGKLFTNDSLPMNFKLNILVTNPHNKIAKTNRLEWIFIVDHNPIAKGISTDPISIEPHNGKAIMPINITMDLYKVFNKKTLSDLLKIVFSLTKNEKIEVPIQIKIKPSYQIGNRLINSPGYIPINL